MSPDPTTLALKLSKDGEKKEGMKGGEKEKEDDEGEWTTPMVIILTVLIIVGFIALLALGLGVVSFQHFYN